MLRSLLIPLTVDNDFHRSRGLFPLFGGLEIKDMDSITRDPAITDEAVTIGKVNGNGHLVS
jgi:hypothetical protein